MNKYEAMFIIKPDLSEEERKSLFTQINDAVSRNNGNISSGSVWTERKNLYFSIKRYKEGLYYLMGFSCPALSVKDIRQTYKLNENILRVLITRIDK